MVITIKAKELIIQENGHTKPVTFRKGDAVNLKMKNDPNTYKGNLYEIRDDGIALMIELWEGLRSPSGLYLYDRMESITKQ